MLNATIIYLKDNDNGEVEINMELIGYPSKSYVLGNEIVGKIHEAKKVIFAENEFSRHPPSNRLQ
jgi:hypothetical protein